MAWQFGPTFSASGTSTNAEIRLARSLDGGATFSAPVTLAAINSLRQDAPVGYSRARLNDHPRVAVATSGPHRGRVYVSFSSAVDPVTAAPVVPCPAGTPARTTCQGQRLVSTQSFVTFSDDRGQTWSTPQPIAPAPPATGVKRVWPVVTVEPGGVVNVVYLQSQERPADPTSSAIGCSVTVAAGRRRVGTASSLVDTFVASSSDGGVTFGAPLQVSSATSNWCTAVSNITPNFGDYIGSASAGNRTLALWADGRNGVPETFYAAVLGAGRSA